MLHPAILLGALCCCTIFLFGDRGVLASNAVSGGDPQTQESGIRATFDLTIAQSGWTYACLMVSWLSWSLGFSCAVCRIHSIRDKSTFFFSTFSTSHLPAGRSRCLCANSCIFRKVSKRTQSNRRWRFTVCFGCSWHGSSSVIYPVVLLPNGHWTRLWPIHLTRIAVNR
jgi:hypothetical protein